MLMYSKLITDFALDIHAFVVPSTLAMCVFISDFDLHSVDAIVNPVKSSCPLCRTSLADGCVETFLFFSTVFCSLVCSGG